MKKIVYYYYYYTTAEVVPSTKVSSDFLGFPDVLNPAQNLKRKRVENIIQTNF